MGYALSPLDGSTGMKNDPCRVVRKGSVFELRSAAFVLRLDTASGLRALAWENRKSRRVLSLGNGFEFGCTLDRASHRLPIGGWRATGDSEGHRKRCHHPEFDDSEWTGCLNPAIFGPGVAPKPVWARTHVFVPLECARQRLTLVLGGIGLWDFRVMRVFLNGTLVGTRRVNDRWHEPGQFDIARLVRFGQDNVIALELRGQVLRTKRLDELDPPQAHRLPWSHTFPAQFEQVIVAGEALEATSWSVKHVAAHRPGQRCEAVFHLTEQNRRLQARVAYRWRATEPTLHKFVEILNRSSHEVRLMDVELGKYRTSATVSEGEQGFPVYAFAVPPSGGTMHSRLKSVLSTGSSFFFSIAHPSGWAMGQRGAVVLRQHPGERLAPGETFQAMEVVLGVAEKSKAREAFVAHVRRRMRRVRRGHDRPYAIIEPYGSWPIAKGEILGEAESEIILLDTLRKLATARRKATLRFDLLSVDFWVDNDGDLQRPDPVYFPTGFANIRRRAKAIGLSPGLWIDSSMGGWTIGDNPIVGGAYTHGAGYSPATFRGKGFLCRATEPVRTLYKTGFLHHVRENGARLLKFDNLQAICYNADHDHLPGLYSTEAIQNSVIEFLDALDRACPQVFLMLYWGHRSPWWLLHADTLFEPGLRVEASSPGPSPTLYARDGVTQGLDMAHAYCEDVPPLGKDSLGVWLSEWPWNSMIGKDRWQEGFVMDMCRGSLLAQPWYGERALSLAEQKQMALFIELLRAQPNCFANPRFIVGNPWKNEPYGYSCSDGQRAFVALHNCTWSDVAIEWEPSERWGLPRGRSWDVYRWYPAPARLTGDSRKIALRPFAVVLLEIVPSGDRPALDHPFRTAPVPAAFAEASRRVVLSVSAAPRAKPSRLFLEEEFGSISTDTSKKDALPVRVLSVRGRVPPSKRGGTLVLTVERSQRGAAFQTHAPGREFALAIKLDGRPTAAVPALGKWTYPSAWQTWRVEIEPSRRARKLRAVATIAAPKDVTVECHGCFIPR